jgi:hypothetical protein
MLPPVAGCGKSLQRAVRSSPPSVPLLFGVVVQRFRDASMLRLQTPQELSAFHAGFSCRSRSSMT